MLKCMVSLNSSALLLLLILSACQTQPLQPQIQFTDYIQVSSKLQKKLKALDSKITAAGTPVALHEVNSFVNSWPYVPDKKDRDVWKTPSQFFAKGGDCEDFAVAKFHALRNNHEVQILVVQNPVLTHAVLLVDRRYVLDNMRPDIYDVSELLTGWEIRYAADDHGIRLIK